MRRDLAIVAVTKDGRRIAKRLSRLGGKFFSPQKGRLKELIGEIFNKDRYSGIIFIMSLGIVIRIIAPYLKDKYRDPAVVVVDDSGRFSISALSGHEGGANKLARKVSSILGAIPVITTASEVKKRLIIGIGCRKGVTKDEVIKAIRVATIDLKRNEHGLIEACSELGVPLRFISRDKIKRFKGKYNRSSLVKKKIGIEGVSEPCALLAGDRTRLIFPKRKLGRVTVAIAEED